MSAAKRRFGLVAISVGAVVALAATPAFAGAPTPSSLKLDPTVVWIPVATTPEGCTIGNQCPSWAWRVEGTTNVLVMQSGYVKGKAAANKRAREAANAVAGVLDPGVWGKKKDTYTKGKKRHKTKIWTYIVTQGNDQGIVAAGRDLVYDRRGKLLKKSGVGLMLVTQEARLLPGGLTNSNSKLLKKQMRKLIKAGAGSRLVGPVKAL
jgi:hypothetical protein